MPDYQKGLIYKIVALNCEDPDEVYYGSTTQGLAKRMGGHRDNYKRWENGKFNFVRSFVLFKNYGIKNCKILLVENYPCGSNYELKAKEADYILSNKCLNKNVPNRTSEKWYNDNKTKKKEYRNQHYADNRNKTLEQQKQYNIQNVDSISKYHKQYYAENKNKTLEHQKKYRTENTDKIKQKFICECGGKYTHTGRARHFKTTKHQTYLSTSEQTEQTPL